MPRLMNMKLVKSVNVQWQQDVSIPSHSHSACDTQSPVYSLTTDAPLSFSLCHISFPPSSSRRYPKF